MPLIKESEDTGEKELMGYRPRPVFNVEDITGLPEDYYKQGMVEFKNSDDIGVECLSISVFKICS